MFLFLTAISGLYGACYSNRHCLNFYSTMIIVMLLAQCVLLVGYFADQSWKKRLPHDDTGEAAKVGAGLCMYVLQTHTAYNLHISCCEDLCARPERCSLLLAKMCHITMCLHCHKQGHVAD